MRGGAFVSDRMLQVWDDRGTATCERAAPSHRPRAHPKIWMNGVVLTNPYYLHDEHFWAAEADELSGHVAAPDLYGDNAGSSGAGSSGPVSVDHRQGERCGRACAR